MPPKQSKKAAEKEKQKVIEDKTFGLKNKNRSSKVQAYVASVTKNVKQGNPDDRKSQQQLEERRKAKEEKRAFEEEMAKLFKAVDKPKGDDEESNKSEEEQDKNLGVAPEDYLWRPEDFDDIVVDDRRLEEKLEAERAALQGRTDLTPVTEESFQLWKQRKKREAEEKEVQRIKKAKESGKGMRGWDLWQMDQDLFVDDEEAADFYEREEQDEPPEEEEPLAEGSLPSNHKPEAASTGTPIRHVDPSQ